MGSRAGTGSLRVLRFLTPLLLAGCARSTVPVLVQADRVSEIHFWNALRDQRVVSNADALYALLLVAEDRTPPASHRERIEAARQRQWLGPGADLPPAKAAEFGWVAVAACEMLDLKGGVTMRLFGPSRRYAARELAFWEITPRRSAWQGISGLELTDLLRRIEQNTAPEESP